jgi:hypothetical protein
MNIERVLGRPLNEPMILDESLVVKQDCQSMGAGLVKENSLPVNLPKSDELKARTGHFLCCFRLPPQKSENGPLALKVHVPPNDPDSVWQIIRSDQREYQGLRNGPLVAFIPPTDFLVGQGPDSRPCQINIQPWDDLFHCHQKLYRFFCGII